ncbi:MAG: Mo-dependent nitrogenase C-terminal domain-containing protein [Cyanobacteria bacterium P01_A01_bin.17]
MTTSTQFTPTPAQVTIWLRGLLTVAWADGQFDAEEQALIEGLVSQDSVPEVKIETFEPISAADLAAGLGDDPQTAENFLRTAVMVALADGLYSSQEDHLLTGFGKALNLQVDALDSLRHTLDGEHSDLPAEAQPSGQQAPDVLKPVRQWLDGFEVQDPKVAKFLCSMIPSQCPFERTVTLFGKKVVHIPPLCKLNPLYEQLVGLRFRSLSYLADDCKEDVSAYI